MSRSIRMLGTLVLSLVACAALASSAGWVPAETVDPWIRPAAVFGAGLLGGGIVLSLLAPIGRMVARSRCVRCRAPIERGQTYCNDHLRETVAEYRDRQSERML